MTTGRISLVVPVRDRESEIVQRLEHLYAQLMAIETLPPLEVVVVDDGSRDGTAEQLRGLQGRFETLRVVAHQRPRGMEAAGQTGLERARGDLVFIQENDSPLRVEDFIKLLSVCCDSAVVLARIESGPEQVSPRLLRRLRLWGTKADSQVTLRTLERARSGMQVVRRSHLQCLAAPGGEQIELESEVQHLSSLESDRRRAARMSGHSPSASIASGVADATP